MKAVIVEIKDSKAAILSDDGRILKIKNNNYEIGQVIQMKDMKLNIKKKIAACAATAAAFVMLGVGSWAYATPYNYVSLDVNPSIEFTLNRFNRVINVKAVNDDGEEIIKEIKLDELDNKSISEAIKTTIDQISELGYFEGDIEGGVILATSGKDPEQAQDLAKELETEVEAEIKELGDTVNVEAISVGLERVEEARELGVTPGKLNLIQKLQAAAADPSSIKFEEWLDKPVKEIMQATKAYKSVSGSAISVSGSAITVSGSAIKAEKEEEKKGEKAKKDAEKAAKKTKEDAEKAVETAEKAAEQAKKDAEKAAKITEKEAEANKKAAEKAAKDAEKAAEKASKAAKKVSSDNSKIENKANQDSIKAAEKAANEAEKAAEKAAKEAEKAAKEAEKAAEKAIKETEKAAKENEKAKSTNSNSNKNTNQNVEDNDEDDNEAKNNFNKSNNSGKND